MGSRLPLVLAKGATFSLANTARKLFKLLAANFGRMISLILQIEKRNFAVRLHGDVMSLKFESRT